MFRSPHGRARRRLFIVGGGPVGVCSAAAITRLAAELGAAWDVTLFEASALGGGREDITSVSHCQMWLHSGAIFPTQPGVVRDLAAARRYYAELCPAAINKPLAVILEPPSPKLPLAKCLAALGVACDEIEPVIVEAWYGVKLPPCRSYRTNDATLDLRLFADQMARRLTRRGVRIVPGRVEHLVRRGNAIAELRLAGGECWKVRPDDVVLLACSSQIPRLLSGAGVEVPGLAVVSSHLAAVEMPDLPLLAVAFGGPTCVPHRYPRPLTIFGDSRRQPLGPEEARGPLEIDPQQVKLLRDECEHWLGKPWGRLLKVWRGRKVEYLPPGTSRSQAHHFEQPLENCHWILPGKMSLAPVAAERWALALLRNSSAISMELAHSTWETDSDRRSHRGDATSTSENPATCQS